jgi:hypothetical protein
VRLVGFRGLALLRVLQALQLAFHGAAARGQLVEPVTVAARAQHLRLERR